MNLFKSLKTAFTKASEVNEMAKTLQVQASVPHDSAYVTLVEMAILEGPVHISATEYGFGGSGDFVEGVDESSIVTAYMTHNGSDLQFTHESQQILVTPLSNIASLTSLNFIKPANPIRLRNGFVCTLRDNRSILVSTPRPVQKSETDTFRTIGFSTDVFGGWAAELSPFGVTAQY